MKSSFELDGVLITLHIDGEQKLFVMLTADGMVRRSGNGSEDCVDTSMYIGKSDGLAYAKAASLSEEVINQWLGSYAAPNQSGSPCRLVVGFKARGGEELISDWEYGTESQGPPPDISRLVVAIVMATDNWHQAQIAMSAQTS